MKVSCMKLTKYCQGLYLFCCMQTASQPERDLHTHSHTHARTHARTHASTQARTHTHTHTHKGDQTNKTYCF